MDVLTGSFKKKIYGSPSGDYHIYRFTPNERSECTVILFGQCIPDLLGLYVLSGKWRVNKQRGAQFVIRDHSRYITDQESGRDYINKIRGMLVAR